MAGINRLVIVMEDIQQKRCTVTGLDHDEMEKFCFLAEAKTEDQKEKTEIENCRSNITDIGLLLIRKHRASKIIPILESMDYEFYNTSDNAGADEMKTVGFGIVVCWRFAKKIC